MQKQSNNVLLPMRLPTQSALRQAVANIIRDIQAAHGETDGDTADRLGISAGTVANARNQKADLNALTIARIGAVYGPTSVDPYNGLYGATAHPSQTTDTDPLADLARAVSAICDMRRSDSPGGRTETPKERLDALPDLKAAAASLSAYIAGIEKMRLVA